MLINVRDADIFGFPEVTISNLGYALSAKVPTGMCLGKEGREMSEQQLTKIPVDLLVYSARNPRTEMRGLEELAENIKQYGVLQPIIVRPKEEKFEVVVGERRVRASVIAGLKEVPAIIRALTDRHADIERLIENIYREDLTNAEKGDAIWALVENYPDKYPTIKSVCNALTFSYSTVKDDWCRKSRKLSDFVKEGLGTQALTEDAALKLSKYEYVTQDRLARCVIENELSGETMRAFFRLYNANPKADLNELADKVKGLKTVRVSLAELSPQTRKEVVEKIKVEHKPPAKPTEKTKKKMRKTLKKTHMRKRKARKRLEERRKIEGKRRDMVPEVPLLPREKELLGEARAKEIQRIVKERKKRAEFMRTRAELDEMEVKLPRELSEEYRRWIEETRTKEIKERNKLNDLISTDEWVRFTKSWFIHNPPPRKTSEILHPAKFPESMIKEFIEFFTKRGQVVLDPFLGTGSTLVACDMTGRIGIGIELEEQWAKIVKTRTEQRVIVGDSKNINKMNIPQVDFVITSPPYWNQLKRASMRQRERAKLGIPTEYSEDKRNIGNIDDYMAFIEQQKEIFDRAYDLLKPGGYLVIVTNNVFFEGRLYPLAFDTAISLSRSGKWVLKDEKIWLQDNKKLLPFGVFNAWVGNRCHEYCLIFRKEGST